MIYLGKRIESDSGVILFFYNHDNKYIYKIPLSPYTQYKWHHSIGSHVENLSTEEYKIPFENLINGNNNGIIIPSRTEDDIYYTLQNIIEKLIFKNI
jgi:hypothetical protein